MWKLQENILSKQDKQLASDFLIKSDRLTQFEYVKDFEKNWSTWQGCKFSTYVNSGSSADLIMLDAVKEYYNIDDFSEVLVPCVTWTTNITSVIQTRLTPVFVDVNLNDFSFDYEKKCFDLDRYKSELNQFLRLSIGLPRHFRSSARSCVRLEFWVKTDE